VSEKLQSVGLRIRIQEHGTFGLSDPRPDSAPRQLQSTVLLEQANAPSNQVPAWLLVVTVATGHQTEPRMDGAPSMITGMAHIVLVSLGWIERLHRTTVHRHTNCARRHQPPTICLENSRATQQGNQSSHHNGHIWQSLLQLRLGYENTNHTISHSIHHARDLTQVLDDWERSAEWYRSLLTFLGLTCVSDTDRGLGGAYDHTPFLYFVGGKTAVGFHKSEGECRGTKFDQRRAGATARSHHSN
jgi:hypothetical protein